MKRLLISAAGLAGLGVLLGGILLWRKLGAPLPSRYIETFDPERLETELEELARQRWAYGSGPGTLAGDDDL